LAKDAPWPKLHLGLSCTMTPSMAHKLNHRAARHLEWHLTLCLGLWKHTWCFQALDFMQRKSSWYVRAMTSVHTFSAPSAYILQIWPMSTYIDLLLLCMYHANTTSHYLINFTSTGAGRARVLLSSLAIQSTRPHYFRTSEERLWDSHIHTHLHIHIHTYTYTYTYTQASHSAIGAHAGLPNSSCRGILSHPPGEMAWQHRVRSSRCRRPVLLASCAENMLCREAPAPLKNSCCCRANVSGAWRAAFTSAAYNQGK